MGLNISGRSLGQSVQGQAGVDPITVLVAAFLATCGAFIIPIMTNLVSGLVQDLWKDGSPQAIFLMVLTLLIFTLFFFVSACLFFFAKDLWRRDLDEKYIFIISGLVSFNIAFHLLQRCLDGNFSLLERGLALSLPMIESLFFYSALSTLRNAGVHSFNQLYYHVHDMIEQTLRRRGMVTESMVRDWFLQDPIASRASDRQINWMVRQKMNSFVYEFQRDHPNSRYTYILDTQDQRNWVIRIR